MPSAPPPAPSTAPTPNTVPARRRLLVPLLCLLALTLAAALGLVLLRGRDEVRVHVPVFLPLEALVVNLATVPGDDDLRMAQVGMALEVPDEHAARRIKPWMASIHSGVLMLVSRRSAADLLNPEGKERLVADVLAEARGVLAQGGDEAFAQAAVRRVLLTNLVIQ